MEHIKINKNGKVVQMNENQLPKSGLLKLEPSVILLLVFLSVPSRSSCLDTIKVAEYRAKTIK